MEDKWSQWENLVLYRLDKMEDKIDDLQVQVQDQKDCLTKLTTRAKLMWSLGTGAVVGAISLLGQYLTK